MIPQEKSFEQDDARGFTLVEMLVALALLGLLTAFLAGGMGLFRRSFAAWRGQTEWQLQAATVHGILRKMLEGAYPGTIKINRSRDLTFDGSSRQLIFTTLMPAATLRGGYWRVKLTLDSHRLILRWAPERNKVIGDDDGIWAPDYVLLEGVRDLKIDYFGSPTPNGAPAWVTSWTQKDNLPRLIRIAVLPDDPSNGAWSPLIAATHIDVEATCIYDPLSYRCQ